MWPPTASPVASSRAHLAERAEPLGDDVVLVDRLEVDLTRRDERAVVELGEARRSRRASSRARSPRRTAGGGAPSRPRAPRRSASSARRSPTTSSCSTISSSVAASISSSHSSVQPMCSVPRPRWLWVATGTASRICSISSASKPSALEPLTRGAGDELLSARARGHALGGDADQPARAELGATARAVQRVELLGLDARHRRRLVLGEPGLDVDLGAARALALADELRDVLGQGLGLERRFAEHDLADRLVDDLLEARHVRALLVRAEVDDALEAGREQLLGAVLAQPDHLFDAGHADPREAQRERRRLRLDVDQQRAGMRGCRSSSPVWLPCGRRTYGGHAVVAHKTRQAHPSGPSRTRLGQAPDLWYQSPVVSGVDEREMTRGPGGLKDRVLGGAQGL